MFKNWSKIRKERNKLIDEICEKYPDSPLLSSKKIEELRKVVNELVRISHPELFTHKK